MRNEEKTFDGVIKAMEETESDKDKFLKAARLQRHESDRRYEMERIKMLLDYFIGTLAMIGGFGIAFYFLYLMSR